MDATSDLFEKFHCIQKGVLPATFLAVRIHVGCIHVDLRVYIPCCAVLPRTSNCLGRTPTPHQDASSGNPLRRSHSLKSTPQIRRPSSVALSSHHRTQAEESHYCLAVSENSAYFQEPLCPCGPFNAPVACCL